MFRKELCLLERNNRNKGTVVFFLAEFHQAIAQSEQRVVFTNTYIVSWVMLGASLTNNDVARDGRLTTKYFNT